MSTVVDINTGRDIEFSRLAQTLEDDFSDVLINASMDGIIGYDRDYRYTIWSPAIEEISGLRADQVIGKYALDLFPFLKEVGLIDAYRASLQGKSTKTPMYPYYVPSTGKKGYCEQFNVPLFDDLGRVTGGMAIVRDVTATHDRLEKIMKRYRELEERVKTLEATLEKLHH
jgi:PAS domain S-box-containing protein